MRTLSRQLRPALLAVVVFTVLAGVAYPLIATALGQVGLGHRADGSLVQVDGTVVGSRLIGQPFVGDEYFWPRPSAASGNVSGGSNLGPNHPDLLTAVAERAAAYRSANGLGADAAVPVDAVTASGSGVDPHISVANARLQAPRVAAARGLTVDAVLALVDQHTDERSLGVLGEPGVNVLVLNLALDGRD